MYKEILFEQGDLMTKEEIAALEKAMVSLKKIDDDLLKSGTGKAIEVVGGGPDDGDLLG